MTVGKRTLVVNRRYEEFDVYVGRPSCWGNPWTHTRQGFRATASLAQFYVSTRVEAIEKYREWILTQPQLLARLGELKGKRLGCWCAPMKCHGEVLAELADALPEKP